MDSPTRLNTDSDETPRPSPLNPRATSFVPNPFSRRGRHPQTNLEQSHALGRAGHGNHTQNSGRHEPPLTADMLCGVHRDMTANTRISPQAHLQSVENQRAYILQQLQSIGSDIDATLEEIVLRRAGWGSSEANVMEPLEQRVRNSRGLHEWLQSKYVELDNEVDETMTELVLNREEHERRERNLEGRMPIRSSMQEEGAWPGRGRGHGFGRGYRRGMGRGHWRGDGGGFWRGRGLRGRARGWAR